MDLGFEVVDLPATDHVAAGDTAPDFTRPVVNDEYWKDTSLSELTADGPVVLVFYPMDGAFPATYIWNELRDRGFAEYDATTVGVSISTPYEHKDLIAEREMAFDLFSDPRNAVAEEYGVAHDLDGMTGLSEPRPAAFVIDGDRTVQYAWVAGEWPEFPDYDELAAAVEDL
jgi:peroxiredoxin